MPRPFPTRQIHLDFHTGPDVPDVGRDFDAAGFARAMKKAHVTSVTVFAKCHHGHLYFTTKHPARHPGLIPGLDLLGEQVEALHREGIRAPIYLSVQCDEFAANSHPEWVARNPDNTAVGAGPLQPGWQILDMNSPYQDYLAAQTAEVLRRFKPVDGIFFDMCWDQPSVGNFAVAAMERAGLDPANDDHRRRHAHAVAIAYMKRFHAQVRAAAKDATVYFNSRPLDNLAEEIPYLAQVEIEALPTGGWGYLFFPKNVRFARTFGKPYLGMTARFHKSWADFGGLKPYAALEYETAQMLAHGACCSIGDQLHPRGTLDRGAYDLIGKVYERVEAREPWTVGATSVAQIGLFQLPWHAANAQGISGTDEGATRMLTQLKHQFDVVTTTSKLENYELLVLPDALPVDTVLAKRLTAYVAAGGKLLASGTSGLSADGTALTLKLLGLKPRGKSPFQTTYLRFAKGWNRDLPPSDHVVYDRGLRVVAPKGAAVACRFVEPYFDRAWDHFCSHNQTPGATLTRHPGAFVHGRIAYVAFPVFASFATHGNYPYRLLVRDLLDRLLSEPLLTVQAPTSTEATVMRQPSEKRTIVHLLQYCPERRTPGLDIVEDIVPLHDVALSLKIDRAPRRVYLAPTRRELPFRWTGGRCAVTVPVVNGHEMVVFE